jgi:pSer/pThr/pTyr-binding forkhead associated (FHA) protein
MSRAVSRVPGDFLESSWFSGRSLESPTVSRHHARICVSGSGATIEDLGSKNGTYLHGERISAAASLVDGDEIRLGSMPVTIRLLKAAGSTVTQRSS